MNDSQTRATSDRRCENAYVRPGDDFSDAIDLDGWDEYSHWGWDPQAQTFYAQLWRNTSDPDDPPDVWLSGANPGFPTAASLAWGLVAIGVASPLVAVEALCLRDPFAKFAPADVLAMELDARLTEVRVTAPVDSPRESYFDVLADRGLLAGDVGALCGLLWLTGRQLLAPVFGDQSPASPERIEAERVIAEGRRSIGGPGSDYFVGVERALLPGRGRA